MSLSFVSQRIESGTYQLSFLKDVRWGLWSKNDSRQNSGAAVTFTLFITASHQSAVSRATQDKDFVSGSILDDFHMVLPLVFVGFCSVTSPLFMGLFIDFYCLVFIVK